MNSLRFGFVGWNPFQLRHTLDIARSLPGSAMIVETRGRHAGAFDDALVTEAGVPVYFWPRGRMRELDGIFDVLVCQTVFTHIEHIEQSKIAMLQYGLAKEPHNYGSWRAFADLCLVYGPYSAEKIEPFAPVRAVGNPRLDGFFGEAFERAAREKHAALARSDRPRVLYVPTWGDLSTQDEYLDAVLELSRDHEVLLKLHHNTVLLEPDRKARLDQRRVHYFGPNDDLLELLVLADVVLSDYSGAIFDALYAKKPVLLLQSGSEARFGDKLDEQSLEYAARDRIGPVVGAASALRGAVARCLRDPREWAEENARLVREVYVDADGAVERAAVALEALARGELEPPGAARLELRELERAARLDRPTRAATLTRRPRRWPLRPARLARRFSRRLSRRLSLRRARVKLAARLIGRANTLLDDARTDEAYRLLRYAASLDRVRGAVRKVTLEAREGRLEPGRETLAALLALPAPQLAPQLAAIQRVSSYFPELRGEIARFRRATRAENLRHALRSSAALERAVRRALDGRWLDDARALAALGERAGMGPSDATRARLASIVEALGPLAPLVEAAQYNEDGSTHLRVFRRGRVETVSERELDPERTIELFLPTPFFALDDTEKPTYEIVRATLRRLYAPLLERDELTLVPRVQFNWRVAAPRTGCRVVSYHTRGEYDPRRFHIQEAPLFGFCSVDHQGYAGFAAHVDRPELIEASVQGVPDEELEANFRELQRHYVGEGISKYAQSSEPFTFEGRYVFVPLQMITDEVASLAFIDGLTLVRALVEAYDGTDVRVVVKRHPYCRSAKVRRALRKLSRSGRVVLSSASIHSLIERAEAVYTVNSGVGLEALLHEKPVVVTGKCDYIYAATLARTVEELRAVAGNESLTNAPARSRKLFHYLRHRAFAHPTEGNYHVEAIAYVSTAESGGTSPSSGAP